MKKIFAAMLAAAACGAELRAETVVDVTGRGAEKITVSVEVSDSKAWADCLRRNLDISGLFMLVKPGSGAALTVAGAAGGEISANGRGKRISMPSAAKEGREARNEARRFADKLAEVFAQTKGFASDPIVFVSRKGKGISELCECYPDGMDIRQLTSAGKTVVGPRWRDDRSIFYTAIHNAGPQIYEYDTATGRSTKRWSFRGLATGATVSPDGRHAAMILSVHGNPELYVIDMQAGTWQRLTRTPFASEGQPAWSPDGAKIAYVSDESRRPHIYVVDVATKKKTRITSSGTQNVDPDWGPDGRIVFISRRDGAGRIAIADPSRGPGSVEIVDAEGSWEHPSWSRDGRHCTASSGDRLFVVDTLPKADGGDSPRQIFSAQGKWITPTWRRK